MSGNNCKVGRSFLTQEKIPDLRSKTVAMQKDHEENKSGRTESKTGNLHINSQLQMFPVFMCLIYILNYELYFTSL